MTRVLPPMNHPPCACGHPHNTHHRTATGNHTYCTVWDPNQCPCTAYTPHAAPRRPPGGAEPPTPYPNEGPPHAAP